LFRARSVEDLIQKASELIETCEQLQTELADFQAKFSRLVDDLENKQTSAERMSQTRRNL
jgi:hypothetical protein